MTAFVAETKSRIRLGSVMGGFECWIDVQYPLVTAGFKGLTGGGGEEY